MLTTVAPCQCTHRGGMIGWTKTGGAHLGNLPLGFHTQNSQCVDVAGLALVNAHACGGIALNMLDGGKIFTHGQANV